MQFRTIGSSQLPRQVLRSVKTLGADLSRVYIFNNPTAIDVFISLLLDPEPPGNVRSIEKRQLTSKYCDFSLKAILESTIDVLANSKHKSKSECDIAEVKKMITLYTHSPLFASLLKVRAKLS